MNKWINKWIKVNEIPEHVKRIPSRNSSANYEAIFRKFLQKIFKYWRKQIVIVLFSLQNGKISTNIVVKGTVNLFSNEEQMKKMKDFVRLLLSSIILLAFVVCMSANYNLKFNGGSIRRYSF